MWPLSEVWLSFFNRLKNKNALSLTFEMTTLAYCEQHHLAFPQFHTVPLSAEPSSSSSSSASPAGGQIIPRSRIWLFLRGLKFELPRVRASVAEERLAEKVVAHLRKLDDEAAATAAATTATAKEA